MGTTYTVRSGADAHPEATFIQMITDFVIKGGVEDLNTSDNHMKVVQRGAGANMSVDIGTGRAMVRKEDTGDCYPVRHATSATNQSVTSNSSGQTRKDAVVCYIDLAASPNTDASNVAKFAVVAGTPSGSPVAPTDSEIAAAIGSSNPFIRLADITVANAAASITNANILDQRNKFKLRSQIREVEDTPSTGAVTIDVSTKNYHLVQLSEDTTFSVRGDSVNDGFVVKVVSNGHLATWWSNIDWFGGTPVLTPTAGKVDSFLFVKKANGRYDGYTMGQDATTS